VGKQSKRPGRAARDIHAVILAQAAELKASPGLRISDADDYPELAALLHCCRRQVEAGVPSAVSFEGHRYFLRVRLALQLDVFDSAGAAAPLISGATASAEDFGHVPGH
jgi:hypothetical protein